MIEPVGVLEADLLAQVPLPVDQFGPVRDAIDRGVVALPKVDRLTVDLLTEELRCEQRLVEEVPGRAAWWASWSAASMSEWPM